MDALPHLPGHPGRQDPEEIKVGGELGGRAVTVFILPLEIEVRGEGRIYVRTFSGTFLATRTRTTHTQDQGEYYNILASIVPWLLDCRDKV